MGDGGDVMVKAFKSVEVIGVAPGIFRPSVVAAATFNAGDAGSVTVNTSRLALRDGGIIGSATFAGGNARSLTINASESVEVSGPMPGSRSPSIVSSTAPIFDEATRLFFGLQGGPSGDSGDLTINTPSLRVTNGGLVTVENNGQGNPGRLRVNVDSLFLDNGGISATSLLGQGGNIDLQVRNDIVLRDRSGISTRAGTEDTGGGDGGNIAIDTGVVAVLENSNVNANAFKGAGGNIRVTTRGLFVSPDSSISASSTLGVDGMVEVNRLGVDPSQGLVELPENFSDPSDRITTDCATDTGNQFVITGRGGLPEDPSQMLRGRTVWQDLRPLEATQPETARSRESAIANSQFPIVEARSWVINANGRVELVAYAPEVTPQPPRHHSANCSK
jgi:large exoprotein involved in heme utilization and adhesion